MKIYLGRKVNTLIKFINRLAFYIQNKKIRNLISSIYLRSIKTQLFEALAMYTGVPGRTATCSLDTNHKNLVDFSGLPPKRPIDVGENHGISTLELVKRLRVL